MKPEINRVVLTGYVGKMPDIRHRDTEKRVGTLSLATHRRYKEESFTDWHRVVSFKEDFVTLMEKKVARGAYLYVEGRLQTRKWKDKAGKDHYTTEIILDGPDHKLFVLEHEKHVPIEGRSLMEAFE